MKRRYEILYNFDGELLNQVLQSEMEKSFDTVIAHSRASIIGVMEYLEQNQGCDILVVNVHMVHGELGADELGWMKEHFNDLRVIPLLPESYRGTDYMVELYRHGILDALFLAESIYEDIGAGSVLSKKLCQQIVSGRSHKIAQSYYGILGRVK